MGDLTRYVAAALTVAVLALVWALRSGAAKDERARIAEARADSLAEVRAGLERQARADSLRLDSAQVASERREAEIATERARLRQRASVASREAGSARDALRATLDSLGASTADLDRLVTAHAAQIAAVEAERDAADSLAATRLSLLQATDRALQTERAARGATLAENAALRDQAGALKAGRRRDRVASALVVTGVVVALVLR